MGLLAVTKKTIIGSTSQKGGPFIPILTVGYQRGHFFFVFTWFVIHCLRRHAKVFTGGKSIYELCRKQHFGVVEAGAILSTGEGGGGGGGDCGSDARFFFSPASDPAAYLEKLGGVKKGGSR